MPLSGPRQLGGPKFPLTLRRSDFFFPSSFFFCLFVAVRKEYKTPGLLGSAHLVVSGHRLTATSWWSAKFLCGVFVLLPSLLIIVVVSSGRITPLTLTAYSILPSSGPRASGRQTDQKN
ncbi:hypothetical protein V8C44DRAFT_125759 [Trichoderma aethiopicum]